MRTKYDELIELYIDTDIDNWTKKPVLIEESVMATEAHMIIIVPKHLVSLQLGECPEKTANYIKNNISQERNLRKVLHESELKLALSKATQEEETRAVGKDVICTECKGESTVEWSYSGSKRNFEKEFDCPVCDGSGMESERRFIPTGNLVASNYEHVQIHESIFSTKLIKVLVRSLEILQEDTMTLVSQPERNRPSIFDFKECSVLVMPIGLSVTDRSEVIYSIKFEE